MSGEFNIHAARRLENQQLALLREASAVTTAEDLNRLLCAFAAKGGTFSTSLLNEEAKVIFASSEKMIDTAIANRMELSASAPQLLVEQPDLGDFRRVLDEIADCAVTAVQQLHAGPAPAGRFPAPALRAVLRDAEQKATALKKRIDIDIQKMALKGMATPSSSAGQITNNFHGAVGNVAQQSENVHQITTTNSQTQKTGTE
jgi:hypothetical protein